MTSLLIDHGICLPPPLSATTCSICLSDESEHVEVAIRRTSNFGAPSDDVVGTGVWNVSDKSLCHSEAIK